MDSLKHHSRLSSGIERGGRKGALKRGAVGQASTARGQSAAAELRKGPQQGREQQHQAHHDHRNRSSWLKANGDFVIFAFISFIAMVVMPARSLLAVVLERSSAAAPFSGATLGRHEPALVVGRRQLQQEDQSVDSFEFYTATVLTICAWSGSAVSETDLESALLGLPAFGLNEHSSQSDSDNGGDGWRLRAPHGYVTKANGTEALECSEMSNNYTFNGEQFELRLYNNKADGSGSPASEVASAQVDAVFQDSETFFVELATRANAALLARRILETTSPGRSSSSNSSSSSASNLISAGDEMKAEEMFVSKLGYIVGFFETEDDGRTEKDPDSRPSGVIHIGNTEVWWPWYMWLITLAIILLCLLPLFSFVLRSKRDLRQEEEEDMLATKQRDMEGLNKIYGPEYGLTEVDFDQDYMDYNDEGMRREYEHVHNNVVDDHPSRSTGGRGSVADSVWQQQSQSTQSKWGAKAEKREAAAAAAVAAVAAGGVEPLGGAKTGGEAPSRGFDMDDVEEDGSDDEMTGDVRDVLAAFDGGQS